MHIVWLWMLLKGHPWEPIRIKKLASSRAKEPPITQPLLERLKTEISDTSQWILRQPSPRAAMTVVISRLSTTSLQCSKSRRSPVMPTSIQFTRIRATQICNNMAHQHQVKGRPSAEAPRKRPRRPSTEDSWSRQDNQTESSLRQFTTIKWTQLRDSALWRVMISNWRSRKYIHKQKNWSRPFNTSRLKTAENKLSHNPKTQLVTTYTIITLQEKSKTAKSFSRKLITFMMMSKSPKLTKRISWGSRWVMKFSGISK